MATPSQLLEHLNAALQLMLAATIQRPGQINLAPMRSAEVKIAAALVPARALPEFAAFDFLAKGQLAVFRPVLAKAIASGLPADKAAALDAARVMQATLRAALSDFAETQGITVSGALQTRGAVARAAWAAKAKVAVKKRKR